MAMIYLDHAATSPMLDCAKRALLDAIDNFSANPSSLHTQGHLAKLKIEEARVSIASLINAEPEEIIFTSGGTESNNTIIHSFKNQVISVSSIEHQSIIEPAKEYAKKLNFIPVDHFGFITDEIPKNSNLVSIMLANNEIGTIEPLEKLTIKNSYLHSDLTQALGKIPIDVKKLNLDYATLTAHKIGGPTGVGALYIKKNSPIKPLILGGHQENNLRAGTYNTAAIISFGAAADFIKTQNFPKIYHDKILPLRNYLATSLQELIPETIINTPLENSLPNLLNVSFDFAEGESTQLYLDLSGIEVSTGSACASGEPSYALLATTKNSKIAHNSIRFSFDQTTTKSEIDQTITKLVKIVQKIRSMTITKGV